VEYSIRKASKDGRNARCKLCTRDAHNRDGKKVFRNFRNDLKWYYGITIEEYENLLISQNHKCAICGADKPGGRGRWHIDHNHETQQVRGILCHKCNVGLGHFNDNTNLLHKALNYLGYFETWKTPS
jgi:hypothetical protein